MSLCFALRHLFNAFCVMLLGLFCVGVCWVLSSVCTYVCKPRFGAYWSINYCHYLTKENLWIQAIGVLWVTCVQSLMTLKVKFRTASKTSHFLTPDFWSTPSNVVSNLAELNLTLHLLIIQPRYHLYVHVHIMHDKQHSWHSEYEI